MHIDDYICYRRPRHLTCRNSLAAYPWKKEQKKPKRFKLKNMRFNAYKRPLIREITKTRHFLNPQIFASIERHNFLLAQANWRKSSVYFCLKTRKTIILDMFYERFIERLLKFFPFKRPRAFAFSHHRAEASFKKAISI